MEMITSNQNSFIKEVKSLKLKKNREDKKFFFIEGERFVEEAVKEEVEINKIFISDSYIKNVNEGSILRKIEQKENYIYLLPDKLFQEISDTENPQGILAIIKMKEHEFSDVFNEKSFIIILDSIQDPGNMGTIIRTADAVGATGIIYSKGCVDIYNPKVLRGSMGSIFHLPVVYCENLFTTIEIIKKRNIKIYAAHLKADKNYFDVDMHNTIAIIIGNEANGINDELASLADTFVKIPMEGKAESLNASVAAGILMYEVARQRMNR
jgi:RNA methyltransferase, TrmH family